DAHQRCRTAVERHGLEHFPRDRALEEVPDPDEHGERYGDDEEALVGTAERSPLEAADAEGIGNRHWIRRERYRDGLAEYDQHPQQREDRGEDRGALLHQRP